MGNEHSPLVFAQKQDRAVIAIFGVTDADLPAGTCYLNAAITVLARRTLKPHHAR